MNSSTGNPQTYEAGDQRHPSDAEYVSQTQSRPDEAAKEHMTSVPRGAHNLNDPKDERSLRNRLRAEQELNEMKKGEMNNEIPPQTGDPYNGDPTSHAAQHGNKPSRGAEIDKELKEDDERRLREKGIKQ
ncbi:uncharacterized protein PHACADRAFT_24433 [Phanerochaete carnosa HHB-10118-sp]|uniref:Uncharacterized protein n=1 Tax=Phanerochaete carnosa (strain HHB-10118-sp) TaxID=650164 RepID=K5VDY9_PHACS|nr:uncharacterized protein PHACADRAFT_24433 [Phanerochaete carnosa HHB-10118-sp]EKM61211.1 hypothetical protein PHACADRAFT_24433 [Phanerochaete carnosa HHB-10118-sp]